MRYTRLKEAIGGALLVLSAIVTDTLFVGEPGVSLAVVGLALAGGAIGGAVLGGIGANKSRQDQQRRIQDILFQLSPQSLQATIERFFPELQGLRNQSVGGLIPQLQSTTNRTFQNTQQGFSALLARSGLLGGSGSELGGNASLQLARGGQLNQDRLQGLQFLLNQVGQANNFALGLGSARAGGIGGQPIPVNVGQGVLAGAGAGLQAFGGFGGGGGGGGGGGRSPGEFQFGF